MTEETPAVGAAGLAESIAAVLAAHGPRNPGIRGLIACLCGTGPFVVDEYRLHVAAHVEALTTARDAAWQAGMRKYGPATNEYVAEVARYVERDGGA